MISTTTVRIAVPKLDSTSSMPILPKIAVSAANKAGLTAYLSGLRVRLTHESHGKVQVLTVLPGYVLTKMVAGRKLPPYISAQPEVVEHDIVRAAKRGRSVLYTMWLWRYIMGVTKLIPEVIFKHLHRF